MRLFYKAGELVDDLLEEAVHAEYEGGRAAKRGDDEEDGEHQHFVARRRCLLQHRLGGIGGVEEHGYGCANWEAVNHLLWNAARAEADFDSRPDLRALVAPPIDDILIQNFGVIGAAVVAAAASDIRLENVSSRLTPTFHGFRAASPSRDDKEQDDDHHQNRHGDEYGGERKGASEDFVQIWHHSPLGCRIYKWWTRYSIGENYFVGAVGW